MKSTRTPGRTVLLTHASAPRTDEVFPAEAMQFLAGLHRRFRDDRERVLAARAERRLRLLTGGALSLRGAGPADPAHGEWTVVEAPADLRDRRVEIAGPVTARIAVNALHSGAQVWIADLEDATTPSWSNLVAAYGTLIDAAHGRLGRPGRTTAAIIVRPRAWHLPECHVVVDGEPMAASLVDFGLYLFHCAAELLRRGSGPYFYLCKMEDKAEAQLWEDVFCYAQDQLGLPRGSIRATVIIETITAAFEMPEILYTLRGHASGLTAGRWDYLFSIIKNFRNRPDFVLPDRGSVTMTVPFLEAYAELLIETCHRHAAHAIGGVAAVVPSRSDIEATARAHAAVTADKRREAAEGFDGSWVVHPDLVQACAEPFTAAFAGWPHQIHRPRAASGITAADLLAVDRTPGSVTMAGLRSNIAVSVRYLTEWLGGNGSARIFGLMEGLATVEIARSQIWQWIGQRTRMAGGTEVTAELVTQLLGEEVIRYRSVRGGLGEDENLNAAVRLFKRVTLGSDFPEFLTEHSYPQLLAMEASPGRTR